MGAATLDQSATTDHPILDVLVERWSPRAYDAAVAIDEHKLNSALEAARWSPSANNVQPWRFIVARRGTATHAAIVESLMGFNQAWAPNASALVVAIAETKNANGDEQPWAFYDLGQAVAHFSVQAHAEGLHVHQMAGFDGAQISEKFGLEERFVPFTITAVGDFGDHTELPEALQEREVAPRTRRPIAESLVVND